MNRASRKKILKEILKYHKKNITHVFNRKEVLTSWIMAHASDKHIENFEKTLIEYYYPWYRKLTGKIPHYYKKDKSDESIPEST